MQGTMGTQGPIGPQGPMAFQGPISPRGDTGVQGPRGAQGPVGRRRQLGVHGVQGYVGDRWGLGQERMYVQELLVERTCDRRFILSILLSDIVVCKDVANIIIDFLSPDNDGLSPAFLDYHKRNW